MRTLTGKNLGVLVGVLVGICITCAIYQPGLSGPWQLDDVSILPALAAPTSFNDLIITLSNHVAGPMGRPVFTLSFMLSHALHGDSSWWFRLDNLVLHLVNGVLICTLFSLLLSRLNQSYPVPQLHLVIAFVTMFWLVHPLQVSTVLYAVQRMTQLSACFTLLSLIAYTAGRSVLLENPRKSVIYFFFVLPASFLVAVLSKENGGLVPLFIIIIELTIFQFNVADVSRNKLFRVVLVVWIALPLLLGLTFIIYLANSLFDFSTREFTLQERLMSQVSIVCDYISAILVPKLSWMSLYHDDYAVVRTMTAKQWLQLLLLFGLTIAALCYRARYPLQSLGWLWFVVSHLFESTVFPLELVFEHRNYLAIAGIGLIVFSTLARLRTVIIFQITAVALVVCLAAITSMRTDVWGDPMRSAQVNLKYHPNSMRALQDYIYVLKKTGNLKKSIEFSLLGAKLYPSEAGYYLHVIDIQCEYLRKVEPKFFDLSKNIINKHRLSAYGVFMLGDLVYLATHDTCQDLLLEDRLLQLLNDALLFEDKAIDSKPRALKILYSYRADVYVYQSRYDSAIQDIDAAISVSKDPNLFLKKIDLILASERPTAEIELALTRVVDTIRHEKIQAGWIATLKLEAVMREAEHKIKVYHQSL